MSSAASMRLLADARMLAAELRAIAAGKPTTLNPGEADRFAAVVEALADDRAR